MGPITYPRLRYLVPVSIFDKTSYRKISQSLEAAIALTGTSAALLLMCLSNFKTIRYEHFNTRSRAFKTSRDLTIRRLIGYWNGALLLMPKPPLHNDLLGRPEQDHLILYVLVQWAKPHFVLHLSLQEPHKMIQGHINPRKGGKSIFLFILAGAIEDNLLYVAMQEQLKISSYYKCYCENSARSCSVTCLLLFFPVFRRMTVLHWIIITVTS